MSNRTDNEDGRPQPATYEIRLRGHLDQRWASHLGIPGLTRESDGTTILCGVVDQSALYGLLQRIRDLGLPLISVNQVNPTPQSERTSE